MSLMGFLARFFPPPAYLIMRGFGLDISDRSLKFAEFEKTRDRIQLKRFGEEILEKGIIENGEIKKKESFISFLKKFRENYNLSYPVISLPEEKAYLSLITMPAMNREQIRESLSFQIEEYFPFTAAEVVLDFEILGINKNINHLDVLTIVFPQKIIFDYADCFAKAGFQLLAMEPESLSLARVLIPQINKDNIMIVDFGRTRTTFSILTGLDLRFTSTIVLGGRDLEKKISSALNVDLFKAETIKKQYSLADFKNNKQIHEIIFPTLSALKDEIQKLFAYWLDHFSHIHQNINPEIKQVVLSGGEISVAGFPEYLARELHVPAVIGNPWINIVNFEEYIPSMLKKESAIYAIALGLALRAFEGK